MQVFHGEKKFTKTAVAREGNEDHDSCPTSKIRGRGPFFTPFPPWGALLTGCDTQASSSSSSGGGGCMVPGALPVGVPTAAGAHRQLQGSMLPKGSPERCRQPQEPWVEPPSPGGTRDCFARTKWQRPLSRQVH